MSGFVKVPDGKAITKEAFLSWALIMGPGISDHIKHFGKPRVRVPVERQVPNEADL